MISATVHFLVVLWMVRKPLLLSQTVEGAECLASQVEVEAEADLDAIHTILSRVQEVIRFVRIPLGHILKSVAEPVGFAG